MGTVLEIIGLKNDEEIRRQYRQMLLTAGKEAFYCLSGVILFHETLYQKDDEGVPLIKRAKDNGILSYSVYIFPHVLASSSFSFSSSSDSSSSASPFWAAAPKGSMTYAFTHMGDFLLLLLHLLLLLCPPPSNPSLKA